MRKFWYAGAVVAGGIFLFGAAMPAQADLLPGTGTAEQQADEQLANLLGSPDGVTVENPLRYSTLGTTPLGAPPLVDFTSGTNTPDVKPVLPGDSESAEEPRPDLPAADVVGGTLRRPTNAVRVNNLNVPHGPFDSLPLRNFLGGISLFRGLLPDGGTANATRTISTQQSESSEGGLPLLGGLGGLLPVNGLPKTKPTGSAPDTSGLPAGGMAVVPAATNPAFGQTSQATATASAAATPAATSVGAPAAEPADAKPSDAKPSDKKPTPAATPDDPRLHEEPVDGEAQRAFSPDGRPVAGVDQQYK